MSVDGIMSALGAGSGMNIKQLARDLTDVEKVPRQESIQARIDKTESRISGYGAVMFGLSRFRDAFAALNDKSDFAGATLRNSAPTSFEATASAGASLGQHVIDVDRIAAPQISRSGGFSAANTTLNGGEAFSLEITRGGETTTIAVALRSPEGVVDAINRAYSSTGVTARLVDTGDSSNPYTIVLTGETGADNAFTVGYPAGQSAVAGLDFDTRLQDASDAVVTIDGLTVTRSTNTVEGVIPGVKLDLLAPTATAATLTVGRDTAPVKEKIQGLVTAYNELQDFLDVLSDPKSADEEFGGVLANDSLVRFVRDQARSMVTATSSTPGESVTALRDIGVTLDREGRLQVDANKLDVSLLARFEEIALAFSANTESQSTRIDAPGGLAGDALRRLEALMGRDGPIQSRNTSASSQLNRAQTDLAALEVRMDAVYQRYLNQFAVVDGLVSQMNALRESLKGQFENLTAMYNNK